MNYRETITRRAEFDYLHKKQSGGQGQYGRVVGYMEPLPEGSSEKFEYANEIVGNAIPPNYLPSCKKGFEEAVNSGKPPLFIPQRLCNGSESGLHGPPVDIEMQSLRGNTTWQPVHGPMQRTHYQSQ